MTTPEYFRRYLNGYYSRLLGGRVGPVDSSEAFKDGYAARLAIERSGAHKTKGATAPRTP